MQTSFHSKTKHLLGLALTLALLCFSTVSQAQIRSDKEWFEVDYNSGCAPLTITITNTGINNSTFLIDFYGDPNDPYSDNGFSSSTITPGQSTSNQYTVSGIFLIRVVDNSTQSNNLEDRIDILEVNITAPAPIDFETQLCTQNGISLSVTDGLNDYDYFEVDFGDGSTPVITDSNGNADYSYANQDTYTITVTGKFNNGNSANCGAPASQTVTTIEHITPPVIESVIVQTETSIEVGFSNLNPNVYYELTMLNASNQTTFSIGTGNNTSPTTMTFEDPLINTLTNTYEIFITGSPNCPTANQVASNTIYSIALNLNNETVGNQFNMDINWNISTNNFSPLDLFIGNSIYNQLNTPTGTQTINLADCSALQAIYLQNNQNGATSRSISLIPFDNQAITLPAPDIATAEYTGNAIDLVFPTPNFPFSEIEVFEKQQDGSYNSIGTSSTLYFTDTNISGGYSEVCYTYTYTDECGNVSAISTDVCIELEGILRLPNAFSPNGDNINDTFSPSNGVFVNFQMMIFNSWGELVFQGNDPSKGWDGTYNGKPAPIGAYVYKISYERDGIPTFAKGTVTLIR